MSPAPKPEIHWPGAGDAGDRIVLQHVCGWTLGEGGKTMRSPDGSQRNVAALPRVTTIHGLSVQHVLDPLENEGHQFLIGNSRGHYEAEVRAHGTRYHGSSRVYIAEAICIAALRVRGHIVYLPEGRR